MRILVIKLSSLGDLFHALPAVHNLKVELAADVDWVTQPEYGKLVRCFTDVSRIITFHRAHVIANLRQLISELRETRYDYVIDLQGLLKSAVVGFMARSERRIGPSFHREGSQLFYTDVAGTRNRNRHAVEECLDVIGHLHLKRIPVEFPVRFPDVAVTRGHPRIAMLPVSRWPTKNWPPGHFIDVGQRLRKDLGASLFLMGGSGDTAACARIERGLGGDVTNMAGKLSLPETGGFLKNMDLLISNDSGPVHMAAAVGTPTVVIFGPTDPVRTGPYGKVHRVARGDAPCQPCFSRTCLRDSILCLSSVTPERVVGLAMESLAKR